MLFYNKCSLILGMVLNTFCLPVGRQFNTKSLDNLGRADKFGFNKQLEYLERYEYIRVEKGDNNECTSCLRPDFESTFGGAVLRFQLFGGLTPTGKMNAETLKLMLAPRCGNPDILFSGSRQKRFQVHHMLGWKKKHLTYRIMNTPRKINLFNNGFSISEGLSKEQVYEAIDRAFREWASISSLSFKRVNRKADITIKFAYRSHGDGKPFDGPNGSLAHAFYPFEGGNTHFDLSEIWTLGTGKGFDFFQVAVHEIGHALGLGHSTIKKSVMYAFYEYRKRWKFDTDDMVGMYFLYNNYTITME